MSCVETYYGTGWGDVPYGSPETESILSVSNAVAERENSILVTFTTPIYFSGLNDAKDSSILENWSIQTIESVGYDGKPARLVQPIKIEYVDNITLRVWLDRPMTPYPSKYKIKATNIWTVSQTDQIDNCYNEFGLYGSFANLQPNIQDQMVPQRDFASPQTKSSFLDPLPFIDPSLLGVYNIDDNGDYGFDEGITAYQKRIIRRIVTIKGSFVHLPGYGIGIQKYSKKLSRALDREKFAQDIKLQLLKEPESKKVQVTFTPYKSHPNAVKLTIRIVTTLGFTVNVEHSFEIG